MLSQIQFRCTSMRRELVAVLLLTLLAFAIRVHQIGFYSLSEDESAKWAAVQEYSHGHFAGVNSEHPMLPKLMSWGSIAVGERWGKVAASRHWPSLPPEGWLRLPNVLLGALSAALIYLFCRQLMGLVGSVAASFFWAVAPLAVALNRLTKEETPLTFFTLLACYFYCKAKQSELGGAPRRWYDLSAIAFGFALASQYILHLLGLNALAWWFAGKNGLTPQQSRWQCKRFFGILFISFLIANPVILSPANLHAILQWLHHGSVKHSGYDFDGTLYMNFISRLFAGVPWFYYLWLLLVKTPIPILVALVVGSILLLRDRRTLASCFFVSFGIVQLIGLSVSGAKWIRYSLPLLPFLCLAAGYAVQHCWMTAREKAAPRAALTVGTLILFAWPLLELHAWMPLYSFYLNPIGGGAQNVARYFSPDEVSEFDTREVAQAVCPGAAMSAKLATARPMSMAYYLRSCGRKDIEVVSLYDPGYAPRDGDLIVLEPSRRYFETQRFFDVLGSSSMPHRDIRVGPVLASQIYQFRASYEAENKLNQTIPITQLPHAARGVPNISVQTASIHAVAPALPELSRRLAR